MKCMEEIQWTCKLPKRNKKDNMRKILTWQQRLHESNDATR